MNRIITLYRPLIVFGIPVVFIAFIVFLANSTWFDLSSEALNFAITFDLVITTPVVYYLLIRKTNISKTTVVLVIILGMVLARFILPTQYQYYLHLFELLIFPVIEITIIGYLVYSVRKIFKEYSKRKELTFDFFTALKETCYKFLPRRLVMPVVMEVSVIYYGFIFWKKIVPNEGEFTYHKKSGTIALLVAIIFILAIETMVFHFLLIKWSTVAAWILTTISIYSAIQIFGFIKSMTKRFSIIESDDLKLRYGIMSETCVALNNIETIEITSKEIELSTMTRKLSPFGALESHNLVITFKGENILYGLYGIKQKFTRLLLYVDESQEFKNQLELAILRQEKNNFN